MKFVIVDYGMGNIKSISTTLRYLGVEDVVLSSSYETLAEADKIILPGVGSYGKAMSQIKARKLDITLNELVLKRHIPILGICLGMQLMGLSSDEDGYHTGLRFVNAEVRRFGMTDMKIPHVGFNQVQQVNRSRLFRDLPATPDFYFTHSYRMLTDSDINPSYCNYGGEFVAGFEKDNIAGVQFHPELSQHNGLTLLKNFITEF